MTTDREGLITNFLTANGWGDAHRCPLADDASFRRYERLVRGDDRAILMDAPPHFEDVRPFVVVARHLRRSGLTAPEIYACDYKQGFLLLEDLGDSLFALVMADDPGRERGLYRLAVDGLIHLHKAAVPDNFPRYDVAILLTELSLFVDWYLPGQSGKFLVDRAAFLSLWRRILSPLTSGLSCLTLRDYHAENLILRQNISSEENRLSQLGLLDFQDAVIGHPAYDLVSLLQDARRHVSPEIEEEMFSHYIARTGMDEQKFRRDYAILGAQRNLKIIGIFTRLYLRDGKAGYLDKIPQVQAALARDLAHPALQSVREWLTHNTTSKINSHNRRPIAFMAKKAMILAAGLGTRMRPLSERRPKPLIRVAGKELLSWSLEGLCAAGVQEVVINIHYQADQITRFVHHYYDPRLSLTLSDERTQLLDSGGGVKKALGLLGDDPFLVLNSDIIWQDRDGTRQMLQRLQAFWQPDRMDILMLLVARDQAVGYSGAGDYNRKQDGRLMARGQKGQADYVYAGIMMIKPDCFINSPDTPFSLRRQFNAAEQQQRLSGIIHDGKWYHVGTPEARDMVEKIILHDQTAEKTP